MATGQSGKREPGQPVTLDNTISSGKGLRIQLEALKLSIFENCSHVAFYFYPTSSSVAVLLVFLPGSLAYMRSACYYGTVPVHLYLFLVRKRPDNVSRTKRDQQLSLHSLEKPSDK